MRKTRLSFIHQEKRNQMKKETKCSFKNRNNVNFPYLIQVYVFQFVSLPISRNFFFRSLGFSLGLQISPLRFLSSSLLCLPTTPNPKGFFNLMQLSTLLYLKPFISQPTYFLFFFRLLPL